MDVNTILNWVTAGVGGLTALVLGISTIAHGLERLAKLTKTDRDDKAIMKVVAFCDSINKKITWVAGLLAKLGRK
jgi:hypothetical protein